MSERLQRLADTAWFRHGVTAAILAAGVLVGLETSAALRTSYASFLDAANAFILSIFVVEIVVKIGACGATPWRYFADPWNDFDFVIVALCLLPFGGSSVTVLRLLRLLRVLRLVRALPKLQVLVNALLRSIPSMFYVSVLLFLLFYVYGVASVFLFGPNDPVHFGSLPIALLSLFRVVTLEDWTDVMYIQMYGCTGYGYDAFPEQCTASAAQPLLGALFFVSFVLVGTMIVLNLFIGVIMTGMDEAQREADASTPRPGAGAEIPFALEPLDTAALETRLEELRERVTQLQTTLATLSGTPLGARRRPEDAETRRA